MITLPANTSDRNKHIETFETNAVNGEFEADSLVKLTIKNEAGYRVGSAGKNTATVLIYDEDTPKGISVLALSDSVTESPGATANFLIKSNEVVE